MTLSMTAETLTSLKIGSLPLKPAFNADITEYTATTSNNSNTITVTPDAYIEHDGTPVDNGTPIVWHSGENIVTISVANGLTYTVTVIKS